MCISSLQVYLPIPAVYRFTAQQTDISRVSAQYICIFEKKIEIAVKILENSNIDVRLDLE